VKHWRPILFISLAFIYALMVGNCREEVIVPTTVDYDILYVDSCTCPAIASQSKPSERN
jgi:hypothetical protein